MDYIGRIKRIDEHTDIKEDWLPVAQQRRTEVIRLLVEVEHEADQDPGTAETANLFTWRLTIPRPEILPEVGQPVRLALEFGE